MDNAPAHSLPLVGRHRFARYMLTFDLADAAQVATHLRARTCPVFPGARGQAYRALVTGTRAHTAATIHNAAIGSAAELRTGLKPARQASQPGQHHPGTLMLLFAG